MTQLQSAAMPQPSDRRHVAVFDPLRGAGISTYVKLFARSVASGQHYLVLSIDSDFCFYPEEQAELVSHSKKPRSPTCTSSCIPTKATTPSCSNLSSTPHLFFLLEGRWNKGSVDRPALEVE